MMIMMMMMDDDDDDVISMVKNNNKITIYTSLSCHTVSTSKWFMFILIY